ncbi:sulfatase family protein [Horticoccus sp. 23ND18S-11]|uniref:sulfatase family protein n=1 Tax=Horticoccus sp. 23ND18S-11 TaxID=3391832 RepID=UPI0039C93F51
MKTSLIASTLVALSLLPRLSGAATPSAPPNIVFLFSDDQTARAVGCYGNTEIITPHLDQLARDGVRFTQHYNTTSICMASRASVLTGLYEYRHGCNFEHGDLERRFLAKSYPMLLREAGYFTGFAGKIGFDLQGEPFDALAAFFDRWAGGPGQTFYETAKNPGIARYAAQYPHCSRAYGAWTADFLKEAKQSGRPFSVSISFKAPHLPFTPDPIDLKRYAGKTFARPPNYGVAHASHLSAQSQSSRAATGYREWINDYDTSTALYYALITGVDAAVGMIREALEREGLAGNTVIIFTSDNGYSMGAHGFGDKVLPYEEASKSPLIIFDPRLPKIHAGTVSSALTANVDMAATMLAIAGVPAPTGLDGRNLLPLLAAPHERVRDALPLFNFWGAKSAQSMAIVVPGWKYIHWYYGGDGMKPTDELFDLANDPYELKNLASDSRHAATLTTLRRHYDAELAALTSRVIAGHSYESYPLLFNRTVPWSDKPVAPAVKNRKRP